MLLERFLTAAVFAILAEGVLFTVVVGEILAEDALSAVEDGPSKPANGVANTS